MPNKQLTMLALLFSVTISFFAQRTAPVTTMPNDAEVQRWAHENQLSRDRFQELGLSGKSWKDSEKLRKAFREHFDELYRKPTKEEAKSLLPETEDLSKYERFLKSPGVGIIKLVPNAGCGTKVVNSSPQCLKYTMPGGASSYSFRTNVHRIERLADLTFSGDRFLTNGTLVQGILADIGDVPLEQVSLNAKGIDFISTFQPADEMQQAAKLNSDFMKGVERDGFLYKRAVPAKQVTTYLLRSVAYTGPSYQVFEGVTYDEFSFDERRDIVIAFRVIRKDDDGIVTIIWRKLAEKKAPSFKSPGK